MCKLTQYAIPKIKMATYRFGDIGSIYFEAQPTRLWKFLYCRCNEPVAQTPRLKLEWCSR